MTRSIAGALALSLVALPVAAFEVKGYSPGMEVEKIDFGNCKKVENADSGISGYACDTTLAGEPAQMRVPVFEGKATGFIFNVPNARMQPSLDALSEKYGRPNKPNRYIEKYQWNRGNVLLSIEESQVSRGYSVLLVDFELFNRARKAAASKAAKDL